MTAVALLLLALAVVSGPILSGRFPQSRLTIVPPFVFLALFLSLTLGGCDG